MLSCLFFWSDAVTVKLRLTMGPLSEIRLLPPHPPHTMRCAAGARQSQQSWARRGPTRHCCSPDTQSIGEKLSQIKEYTSLELQRLWL